MNIVEKYMFVILFLGNVLGCSAAPVTQGSLEKSIADNRQSENMVLTSLALVLSSTGQPARLYFHGICQPPVGGSPLFPVMDVQIPSEGLKGLDAVRDIFRNDDDVAASQDASGMIRISIGNVATAILDTPLPSLTFDKRAQYDPYPGAISVIEDAGAFKAASAKLKASQASVYLDILSPASVESDPHLRPSFENTTVEQVLDSVARTFRGIVVYGECKDSAGMGYFDIGFKRGR